MQSKSDFFDESQMQHNRWKSNKSGLFDENQMQHNRCMLSFLFFIPKKFLCIFHLQAWVTL